MKIEELAASLRKDKKVEDVVIPASEPITRPDRLIGPVPRGMSICFPHTNRALRDSMTQDLVDGIARRQSSVQRSSSILMYDDRTKAMVRRTLRPDGHLGGVEL